MFSISFWEWRKKMSTVAGRRVSRFPSFSQIRSPWIGATRAPRAKICLRSPGCSWLWVLPSAWWRASALSRWFPGSKAGFLDVFVPRNCGMLGTSLVTWCSLIFKIWRNWLAWNPSKKDFPKRLQKSVSRTKLRCLTFLFLGETATERSESSS